MESLAIGGLSVGIGARPTADDTADQVREQGGAVVCPRTCGVYRYLYVVSASSFWTHRAVLLYRPRPVDLTGVIQNEAVDMSALRAYILGPTARGQKRYGPLTVPSTLGERAHRQ